jgi:iron(III) transport system substrate-binding protein
LLDDKSATDIIARRNSGMRRFILPILFLIVLATPLVLGRIYRGAGSSALAPRDALQLVVVTPNVESIRREFGEAFSAWHQQKYGQAVFVDYRMLGGASDIVRFFETSRDAMFAKQGTFGIDVAWGGGDFLFDKRLKRAGVLEPIKLPDELLRYALPRPQLGGVDLYDAKDGTWYGASLSSFGICFNRDVCRYLNVSEPRTWSDLADPRFAGWLVLADPTRSGAANQAFMTIVERAMLDAHDAHQSENAGWARGMGLIRQIAANARLFTDASSSIPNVVASGDAAAAMTIDFYGRSEVEAVGESRMGYVEPSGATSVTPDPIAVVKGAPHREPAIRFVEFVLSPQGQRLWLTRAGAPGGPRLTSLRRLPVAPDAYHDKTNLTDRVDPYADNLAFPSSPARKRTFTVLGKLVELSCIDLLDELRETRAMILAAHRDDLDARLGVFSFNQAEALRRDEMWRKAPPDKQLELERTWKAEFREEYRALRAAAGGGSR